MLTVRPSKPSCEFQRRPYRGGTHRLWEKQGPTLRGLSPEGPNDRAENQQGRFTPTKGSGLAKPPSTPETIPDLSINENRTTKA